MWEKIQKAFHFKVMERLRPAYDGTDMVVALKMYADIQTCIRFGI
jgi:hypothetical protein